MQLLRDISTCGASAGVFAQPRPKAVISRSEIPQCSSLLPSLRYAILSQAREMLASETAQLHHAARRRGGLAARSAGAAAGDAGGQPPDPFRLLPMVVARANVAVGRIRRRLEPAFRWSRSDPAWLVTSN